MALHVETPLVESRPLGRALGRAVRLKMESAQPPGSFKIRGISAACEAYVRRGRRRLVSSSGGNAGIAVAYAGRRLGIPVVVVVPETTSGRAKELIGQEGAEVVVHGATWQEANDLAVSMAGEADAFIHPFDDPLVWGGHATMVDEVARAGPRPDVVVLSVGGGGLLAGVVEGLRRNGWHDVPVVAAETEGASSYAQSVRAGERIELAAVTSVATTLGAKRVCERAFDLAGEHPIRCAVVTDRAAVAACNRFLDDHRVLTEPACGAALALAYDCAPELAGFDDVLVIVCGGATATADQLRVWAERLA